jgi:hypothetical protein
MNNSLQQETSFKTIFQIGAFSCFFLLAYSLATILIMVLIGPPPETVEECYSMIAANRVHGLLRLDLLTVFIMPFYYLLFLSLFFALKNTHYALVLISTILVFAGVALFLATPSVFSYLHLSDKFAAATSEHQKNQLLAAGESILASDMWHGTGARVGGLLMQSGAVLISIIMLKSNSFGKLTAVIGIVTHGLDLAHIIIGFFLPSAGIILMSLAGPLYLLWFPLVGVRLFKIKNTL